MTRVRRALLETNASTAREPIVHRDLKPTNILAAALREPHILGFGLARRTDGHAF